MLHQFQKFSPNIHTQECFTNQSKSYSKLKKKIETSCATSVCITLFSFLFLFFNILALSHFFHISIFFSLVFMWPNDVKQTLHIIHNFNELITKEELNQDAYIRFFHF